MRTIFWVDSLMTQWGICLRDHNELGYPSASVEARMMDGVLTTSKKHTRIPVHIPPEIETCEQVMLIMPEECYYTAKAKYIITGNRDYRLIWLSTMLNKRVNAKDYGYMIKILHNRFEAYSEAYELFGKKLKKKFDFVATRSV